MGERAQGWSAGLAGWRGAALALILSVLLCWPMLLTTAPLVFFDTFAYYSAGEKIVAHAGQLLAELWPFPPDTGGAGAGGSAGSALGNADEGGLVLRSIVYSIFLYVTAQTPLGLVLTAMLQTAMTLWLAFLLLCPDRQVDPLRLALAGAGVVGLSTLPWFASYAMPDMPAAALVAFYAVALRRFDRLGWFARLAALAIATFAVAAHYGHIPLAAALAGLVLVWRLMGRRLSLGAVLICVVPVLAPMAFNYATSAAALEGGSVAPKRLPILLARSLADGPAAWYLNDACPEAGYAMCEVFEQIPENIGVFLWSDEGIRAATPEQFTRIQQEETAILLAALRAYPLSQLASLGGNAALQSVSIGTDQLVPTGASGPDGRLRLALAEADPVIALFDRVTPIATALAAAWLVFALLTGRVPRPLAEACVVVVAALLVNAAIFGGLSAPVDRYQSRIVWMVPLIVAFAFATREPVASDQSPARKGEIGVL